MKLKVIELGQGKLRVLYKAGEIRSFFICGKAKDYPALFEKARKELAEKPFEL